MFKLALPNVLLAVAAGFANVQPAQADIYTWTDKTGVVNVSNLPPPDDARVTKVTRTAPRDAAREAAAAEAARQAEVRALADRVQQLQVELERRETPPAMAYAPPPVMPYVAPPTYIVNVVSQPAPDYAPAAGGCGYGYGWGDCGFGFWPGFYTATPIVVRSKHYQHRRIGPLAGNSHLIPPLIPLPVQTRPGAGSRRG